MEEPLLDEDREKSLQISEISLWMDNYQEIFSDFDPRPFSQRIISDDFITEAKKEVRDTPHGIKELILLIPRAKRNVKEEIVIKKRLKEFFKAKLHYHKNEHEKLLHQGYGFAITGMVLMLSAAYIAFQSDNSSYLQYFLISLFEPASWFLFWEGLNLIIFDVKKKKPDLEFYEKMHKAEIRFATY